MTDRTLMELARIPASERQWYSIKPLVGTVISHSTCALLRRRGYRLSVAGNHRSPHFWTLLGYTHPAGIKLIS